MRSLSIRQFTRFVGIRFLHRLCIRTLGERSNELLPIIGTDEFVGNTERKIEAEYTVVTTFYELADPLKDCLSVCRPELVGRRPTFFDDETVALDITARNPDFLARVLRPAEVYTVDATRRAFGHAIVNRSIR